MTPEAKAFWAMAFIAAVIVALIVSGCAANLPLAKIDIQETTNTVAPVWPK